MFSAMLASNNSMSCGKYPTWGPRAIRSQSKMGWPSNKTSPEVVGQTPSNTLANVDFPDPEAPKTTVTVPTGMSALMPFKIGISLPGAEATTSFKTTSPFGNPSMILCSRMGCASNKSRSLINASRALRNPPHVPTIKSIGAKARVMSTLAAIMAPGEISPWITNNAPPPKANDCCV